MSVVSSNAGEDIEISPIPLHQEIPNEETKIAIENVKNGIGLSRCFQSIQDLMTDLNDDMP